MEIFNDISGIDFKKNQERRREEEARRKEELKSARIKKAAWIAASGIAVAGFTGATIASSYNKPMDMSVYNVNDDMYKSYMEKSSIDEETIKRIEELEKNIERYENLQGKNLTDEQKKVLEKVSGDIEKEIKDGKLISIYRDRVLKGKLKEAYNVSTVETQYTNDKNGEEISIAIKKDKYSDTKFLDDKDKIDEIKTAIKDIASLQDLEGKVSFTKKDITEFIRIVKNMKGFSNLTFVKRGDEPLTVQENYTLSFKNGEYPEIPMAIDKNAEDYEIE